MGVRLILRIIWVPVIVFATGVAAVFGFRILEPFSMAMGTPPAMLGWGTPVDSMMQFGALGMIGIILAVVLWGIFAPIRRDQRQESF